jgi:hypothetical protein
MFSVRYGPFSFALGAEGSPSYRLNQQYTNVIFDGSIQKQNLAEFGNHERLDDGRTLILAEPNNDWLGPGFCTATSDPPSPAVRRRFAGCGPSGSPRQAGFIQASRPRHYTPTRTSTRTGPMQVDMASARGSTTPISPIRRPSELLSRACPTYRACTARDHPSPKRGR